MRFCFSSLSSTQYSLGMTKLDVIRHSGQDLKQEWSQEQLSKCRATGYGVHRNGIHQDKPFSSSAHILYDLALKLLSAPPLADAFEAVAVVAVGEDAEATLAGIGLLEHHLHTHATHHVLTALDGERELHVLFVGLNACLSCTTA